MKRVRHVKSTPNNPGYVTGSLPTQGRIRPNRVDARYLRRLTDEACRRHHQAMHIVAPDHVIERYSQTRALLEEEIERYRRQDRRIHVSRDRLSMLVTEYGSACRRGGDEEAAYDAVLDALYGADKNGPDGGASQRADSDGAVPTGVDDSKVVEEAADV